jgi:hypothetical protein
MVKNTARVMFTEEPGLTPAASRSAVVTVHLGFVLDKRVLSRPEWLEQPQTKETCNVWGKDRQQHACHR